MTVRRLRAGDEARAADVFRQLRDLDVIDSAPFLADPGAFLFVAEEDAIPVGYAYGYELVRPEGGRAMLLYDVEVAGPARRRGHGRALVEAFLAAAEERGHFEMWVLTEGENEPAKGLYRATGAVPDDPDQVSFTWEIGPRPTDAG